MRASEWRSPTVLRSAAKDTMLQIMVGIVGGGSLLICLWQLVEEIHRGRVSIYSHLSYIAPSPGPRPRQHRCLPSHWHSAYDYRRLEMHRTVFGHYAVVRHTVNRRYYALGRIAVRQSGLERFEDIFGLFDGGRLAYYVFLPGQGVDGHPTRAAARHFIAAQRAATSLSPHSASPLHYSTSAWRDTRGESIIHYRHRAALPAAWG